MSGIGSQVGFTFESLIAPCDSEPFLRDRWGRVPHLEQRRLPDFYDGLLSVHDVDQVVAHYSQYGSDADGRDLDIDAALRRLEQGAALVLEDAHRQIPSLAQVCRSVHAELGFRCNMAIEVTMPSNKPQPSSAVTSHTIVLQIAGRRNWRTAGRGLPRDFVLETGDMLYLPPGRICQHRSTGDESITAVLTVTPPCWSDMIPDDARLDDASMPQTLAEPLPPRWIHRKRSETVAELSRRWRQAEDIHTVEAAVAGLVRSEVRAFPLDLRGRLIETLRPRAIRDDTYFAARRDLLWTLEPNGIVTRLISGPMTIDIHPDQADVVTFCLGTPRFTIQTIPGDQPPEVRRALVDTLMRNMLVHRLSA